MFRRFNLSISNVDSDSLRTGRTVYEKRRMEVHKKLSAYLTQGGTLDGKKMQDEWFPEVNADVFLSHAHTDNEDAVALAGWLKETFELDVFVDSCVWGNASDLLQQIDDNHCRNGTGNTYNYALRNISTSHVHMMLSVALTKMIDRCECVIFLNTPNSINIKSTISNSSTHSPWLFHEIAMTRLVQPRKPVRGALQETVAKHRDDSLRIMHPAPIDHLTPLTANDLNTWRSVFHTAPWGRHSLDVLYHLKPAA